MEFFFIRHLACRMSNFSALRKSHYSPRLFGRIQPPVRLALNSDHTVAERRSSQKSVEGARGGVVDRGGVDGRRGIRIGSERREGEVVEHYIFL